MQQRKRRKDGGPSFCSPPTVASAPAPAQQQFSLLTQPNPVQKRRTFIGALPCADADGLTTPGRKAAESMEVTEKVTPNMAAYMDGSADKHHLVAPAPALSPEEVVEEVVGGGGGPLPPLGKSDVLALIERFGNIAVGGGVPLVPPRYKMFDPSTFVLRAHSNMETHGVKLSTAKPASSGGPTGPVVVRPPYDFMSWYARLDEVAFDSIRHGGALQLYATHEKSIGSLLESRGYTRVRCTHIGDDTHVPPSIRGATLAGAVIEQSPARAAGLIDGTFNGLIKPYMGQPNALKRTHEETVAMQIVREFEVCVQAGQEYYSPYMLLTKQMRHDGRFEATFSDTFNDRAKIYVYIRTHLGSDLGLIESNYTELRKAANASLASTKAGAGKGANASGAAGRGGKAKPTHPAADWYDKAVGVATQWRMAPPEDAAQAMAVDASGAGPSGSGGAHAGPLLR